MSNNSIYSERILCGHQPDFLPWLGVFYKINKSHLFKIADYVKYTKSWTNRVRVKNKNGFETWITVPVNKSDKNFPINEVRIADSVEYKSNIAGILKTCYGGAPFYSEVENILDIILNYEGDLLIDLNLNLLNYCLKQLSIKTPIVMGSTLNIKQGKTEHIIDSCLKLKCNTYLSGQGAEYLNIDLFEENCINLIRSDFQHPVYPQINGSFLPGLSILDTVANVGFSSTAKLLNT